MLFIYSMAAVNKKGLRKLFRDALTNNKVEDLTLLIKTGAYKETKRVGTLPDTFERRKGHPDGEFIVKSPESRIIKPVSRSPDDIWTIIYQNRIVAQGEFIEVQRALRETFQYIISYPSIVSKVIVFFSGIAAIALVFFFFGYLVSRVSTLKSGLARDVNYARDFERMEKSLNKLIQRQDSLKSALVSVSEQLTEARKNTAVMKEAAYPAQNYPDLSFGERLKMVGEERDLALLAELRDKKSELLTKDQELDVKGFTALHRDRQQIRNSIKAIDTQIERLRKKYDLPFDRHTQ
ncbi:MAG: hypothetical protein HY589_00355 [Candidatus Omnitrophica bacterium]|nr:hypothetical protein [Candidatus Omnitrophota bacterium]